MFHIRLCCSLYIKWPCSFQKFKFYSLFKSQILICSEIHWMSVSFWAYYVPNISIWLIISQFFQITIKCTGSTIHLIFNYTLPYTLNINNHLLFNFVFSIVHSTCDNLKIQSEKSFALESNTINQISNPSYTRANNLIFLNLSFLVNGDNVYS